VSANRKGAPNDNHGRHSAKVPRTESSCFDYEEYGGEEGDEDEDVDGDEVEQPTLTGYVKQTFTVPDEPPTAYASSTFPRFPKVSPPSTHSTIST